MTLTLRVLHGTIIHVHGQLSVTFLKRGQPIFWESLNALTLQKAAGSSWHYWNLSQQPQRSGAHWMVLIGGPLHSLNLSSTRWVWVSAALHTPFKMVSSSALHTLLNKYRHCLGCYALPHLEHVPKGNPAWLLTLPSLHANWLSLFIPCENFHCVTPTLNLEFTTITSSLLSVPDQLTFANPSLLTPLHVLDADIQI